MANENENETPQRSGGVSAAPNVAATKATASARTDRVLGAYAVLTAQEHIRHMWKGGRY